MLSAIPAPQLVTLLEMGRQRFLHGLDCVPDDRLGYSSGGSAHTPLQLAGRLAGFIDHRARVLASAPGEQVSRSAPAVPASREEAASLVNAAFSSLARAVEGLSDADLERTVPMPWGAEMSLGAMLLTSLNVVGYFQGQLNYCQLLITLASIVLDYPPRRLHQVVPVRIEEDAGDAPLDGE
jgi:hypothetical protein